MTIDTRDVEHAPDEGMSTAPGQDGDRGGNERHVAGPRLGPLGWARWLWRQLTSMRIALLLLLLLALAAIPGSYFPQRPVSPFKVTEYFREHPTWAKWLDRFQMFDVFSSWWFASVYILLFVSLIGCIVPRVWAHAKAMRARPPKAPSNLSRLPVYATWRTSASAEEALLAARTTLKGRRFRLGDGDGQVAAEKGYARETGNVLFHIALVGVLVAAALGGLYKGSGGKIVIQGSGTGFANTLTQYDDFQSGALFDTKNMEPFGFRLTGLDQTFQRTGDQTGAPRSFTAHVDYWEGADGAVKKGEIKVNHPLKIGNTKVFLIATGYAPDVTVRDARGNVAYSGPTIFIPQDGNRTSTGVIKVPDVAAGLDQIGLSGIFAPTMRLDERGPHSVFPALDDPAMFLTAYHGSLGMDSGIPQNVYQLQTAKMTQYMEGSEPWRRLLRPGDVATLPDGSTVTFNGVAAWGNFQVAKEPGKGLALGSVAVAIAGLILSLFVRRRRVWVRVVTAPDGATVVEVAGLARTEGGGLRDEVQGIVDELQEKAPADVLPPEPTVSEVKLRGPRPSAAGPATDPGADPATAPGGEPVAKAADPEAPPGDDPEDEHPVDRPSPPRAAQGKE